MQSAFLTAALLLGSLATAGHAQQQANGSMTSEANLALIGKMSGVINVPLGGGTGFASGVLTLGTPQYLMTLDLPQGPLFINGGTGAITGPLFGSLKSFPLLPSADVFAHVGGSWTWQPLTGAGHFRADITLPGVFFGPLPPLPIGSMRAMFSDFPQASPTALDPVGTFQGGWFFNLLTATPDLPDGHPFPGPGSGDS